MLFSQPSHITRARQAQRRLEKQRAPVPPTAGTRAMVNTQECFSYAISWRLEISGFSRQRLGFSD